MWADYHLHSSFSDDSREPMEAQIEQGIALGLDEMCFTDHVDYGIKREWDEPVTEENRHRQTNVNYPAYFAKIHEMKEKYGDRICVKQGLEFGIQSHTVRQFEKLYQTYEDELDFVLFSMHQVGNLEFWNGHFQQGRTQEEYNFAYYEEILKTMQLYKNYSVLAHLDLIVRYDPEGSMPFEKIRDIVTEILRQAIRDGKGIEINTSSWHYGLADTQPQRQILRLYRDLGGRILTMGSDAHSKAYLADHFADARKILKEEIGFTEICTFDRMQPIFHAI